jgi:hypothetical protein
MTEQDPNETQYDIPQTPFERIRQVDADDQEFWSARDLMPVLDYVSWQKFKPVLLKAQIACENSGHDPSDHFTGASKMVAIGSDAKREVEDMHLSRYACYLIVQNADPAKEVVALGQTYFAVQTYRQITRNQHSLDQLNTTQFAAYMFRVTQAEDKLRRDQIKGKEAANEVHHQAGVVVRRAIAELGGTMPEDLPTEESIKKLERAEKKKLAAPKEKKR